MGETTGIAWCDHTVNFWIGCTHQSPGCLNCYAETMATNRMGLDAWGQSRFRHLVKSALANARKWDNAARRDGVRRRVFCMSMGDFFENRPEVSTTRAEAWQIIEECSALDWLILTKHAAWMKQLLPRNWGDGWPHVWLGVSVENQEWAEKRIPLLLSTPAALRFLSCEPLLGLIDLEQVPLPGSWASQYGLRGVAQPLAEKDTEPDDWKYWTRHDSKINWVIAGGESGPGHRHMDPAWAVSLRDQCAAAGVAFFFKQNSGPLPGMGALPDGSTPREFPRSAVAT